MPEPAASDPLLDVRDLVTRFATESGELRAVDGVSFAVRAGSTVGVVGESGSGKSVTALSIMKLLPASAPEPIGQASALAAACCNRVTSRRKASACASKKCESRIGWACCMCVMPAIGTEIFALACMRSVFKRADKPRWVSAAASMTKRRKSVATSSFRLRPV